MVCPGARQSANAMSNFDSSCQSGRAWPCASGLPRHPYSSGMLGSSAVPICWRCADDVPLVLTDTQRALHQGGSVQPGRSPEVCVVWLDTGDRLLLVTSASSLPRRYYWLRGASSAEGHAHISCRRTGGGSSPDHFLGNADEQQRCGRNLLPTGSEFHSPPVPGGRPRGRTIAG